MDVCACVYVSLCVFVYLRVCLSLFVCGSIFVGGIRQLNTSDHTSVCLLVFNFSQGFDLYYNDEIFLVGIFLKISNNFMRTSRIRMLQI